MSYTTALVILIVLGYTYYLVHSSNDVKIIPGKFKIKRTVKNQDGLEVTFYTLYVCKDLFPHFHYYKLVGEYRDRSIYDFIEYKFNSVEDAEAYYTNSILENKK